MARVANLDKNPRVKCVRTSDDKYREYKVTLNDTFYRKPYRKNTSYDGNRIDDLNTQLEDIKAKKLEDYAVTEFEFSAFTLTQAHERVNELLTATGWEQYRLGVISRIEDEIETETKSRENSLREKRECATFRVDSGTWKQIIISGHELDSHPFLGSDDSEIIGAVSNRLKDIANTDVNVSEWKAAQITRLKSTLETINNNIALLESINVDEGQEWYDKLRKQAQDCIDGNIKTEEP